MFSAINPKSYFAVTIILMGCTVTSAQVRMHGAHYNATVVRHAPFTVQQKEAIVTDILSRANDLKIKQVKGNSVRNIKVKKGQLLKQPLYLLGALRLMLHSASPGAEMDLMVRTKGEYPRPVQVIWDGDTLFLEAGKATVLAPQKIGPIGLKFVNGSGRWSAVDKAHVRKAIQRLDPEVIELLKDIPLRREKTKRVASVSKGGLYEQKGCFAQIKIYSSAFAGRHLRFIGRPDAPLSKTTATILHEVAHAVHHAPSRAIYCELERRTRTFEAKRARFNGAVKTQNSSGRTVSLQGQKSWLEKERVELEALLERANRLSARGPILAEYKHALKGRLGPTHYGATSTAESFSESFALHFGDPAALQRIWPDMTRWFSKKRYLNKK